MVFRILRPDSISVWKNEELLKRFSRYRGIIDNKEVARYIIAKSIKCEYDTKDTIEHLENLLRKKSVEFNELLKNPTEDLKNRSITSKSYITLAE